MSSLAEATKAIWQAAKSGDTEALQRLVGNDQNLLHTTTPFGTPLHIAARRGDLPMVKSLVGLGADVNARGGTLNGTPINDAASDGHAEVVKYLLDHGAFLDTSEPERNPLFSAIYGRHNAVAKLLLDHGIDSSVRYTGTSMRNMGALEFALEQGASEIARLLQTMQHT